MSYRDARVESVWSGLGFDAAGLRGLGIRGAVSGVALIVGGLGVASTASAVESEPVEARGYQLEEVVVTAQKRAQSLQDVGVAVSAFTGDELNALGFEDSIDIAAMTPGVHIAGSFGGQLSQFTIRGVTQNDFTDFTESPNAVYLDETYISMQQGQLFSLFDVERVEVLKGPQSTLFGRNATGGVVHFVTRKPTDEFEGYGSVTLGRFNQTRVEAAVGGPIASGVRFRASGFYNYHDTIYKNVFPEGAVNLGGAVPGGGEDYWNDETYAGRLHLAFDLNENAELLLTAFTGKTETSTAPYQAVATISEIDAAGRVVNAYISAPDEVREGIGPGGINVDLTGDGIASLRPTPGGDFFGYIDPDGSGRLTSVDLSFRDLDFWKTSGGAARLDWSFDNIELVAVSDYKRFTKYIATDMDVGPADQFGVASQAKADQFGQELRLSGDHERLRWMTGLYYLYIENKTDIGFLVQPTSILSPVFLGAGVGADLMNITELKTNSYSGFGQVEYDLTDEVSVIVGARLVQENKNYDFEQGLYLNEDDLRIDKSILIAPLAPAFSETVKKTLWAGNLALNWRPNDDLLFYTSVKRGVKAGSFNAKLPDGTPPLAPEEVGYGPETLYAYEVGFKSTLFDGTTRINGALYYYDYQDYQASVFADASNVIRNGDAEIFGGELEVRSRPLPGLDVQLSVGLLDAKVKGLEIAPGIFRDVKPTFTPEIQLSGFVRYELPFEAAGGRIAVQADAVYSGKHYDNIRNFDAHRVPDYAVVNLRTSWLSNDGAWDLSAFVENVFDNRYETIGFDLSNICGCKEQAYAKPRWWGLTVQRHF